MKSKENSQLRENETLEDRYSKRTNEKEGNSQRNETIPNQIENWMKWSLYDEREEDSERIEISESRRI